VPEKKDGQASGHQCRSGIRAVLAHSSAWYDRNPDDVNPPSKGLATTAQMAPGDTRNEAMRNTGGGPERCAPFREHRQHYKLNPKVPSRNDAEVSWIVANYSKSEM
jgi:hypothetical protein